MAESSIAKALRLTRERRASGKSDKAGKSQKKKKRGLIANIRSKLSSERNVNRIDSALEAVESGVADADKDTKRKK